MMQPGSTSGPSELLQAMTGVYGLDVSEHEFAVLNALTVLVADVALRWLSFFPSMYMTGMGPAKVAGSAATGATPFSLKWSASAFFASICWTTNCAPELCPVANTRLVSTQ